MDINNKNEFFTKKNLKKYMRFSKFLLLISFRVINISSASVSRFVPIVLKIKASLKIKYKIELMNRHHA